MRYLRLIRSPRSELAGGFSYRSFFGGHLLRVGDRRVGHDDNVVLDGHLAGSKRVRRYRTAAGLCPVDIGRQTANS
jgi:hypothetical protein